MHDYQKEIELINRLLKLQADHKPASQRMAYERGYLTGLLASILHDDAIVKYEFVERIRHFDKK